MIWARHNEDPRWHLVLELEPGVLSACNGAWSPSESCVPSASPPLAERCAACERSWIVREARVRIEEGIAELVANAPEPVRIEWDAIDEGGAA